MSEQSDAQLLSEVRKAQTGIRTAMEKMDMLVAERNDKVILLLERGHTLRGVAREAQVSPQALHIGVTRTRGKRNLAGSVKEAV
jgi:hypothetical protein